MGGERLPMHLTRFIGRIEEKFDIQRLLAEQRLVTLIGAGGVGKTRLAVEVAARVAPAIDGCAWFVDLASVTESDGVPVALARTLGFPDQPGRSTTDNLVQFLGDRSALVLLDNCEHVLDACAAVITDLLAGCRQLVVLATSREPIGIVG